MPLTGVEKCTGDAYAKRLGEAFKNTETTGYPAMREKLTGLGYPAARVHRMPDHAGAPRSRIDLRVLGGRVALEVTGVGDGVVVEVFGAPETEEVKVTDVKRKPGLDAPAS